MGGLYGVAINGLFAGESMFHAERDASKVALVALVERLRDGYAAQRILDVQWVTPHLAGLGVVAVPRETYLARLRVALTVPPADFGDSSAAAHRGCSGLVAALDHFSSRLIRRSASGLPPVWQVGQYCRLESAKLTSRTVSPQTGHVSPVRPCTARLRLLLALQLARRQPARAVDGVAEDGADRVVQRLQLGVVEALAGLNGDIRAACRSSSE